MKKRIEIHVKMILEEQKFSWISINLTWVFFWVIYEIAVSIYLRYKKSTMTSWSWDFYRKREIAKHKYQWSSDLSTNFKQFFFLSPFLMCHRSNHQPWSANLEFNNFPYKIVQHISIEFSKQTIQSFNNFPNLY